MSRPAMAERRMMYVWGDMATAGPSSSGEAMSSGRIYRDMMTSIVDTLRSVSLVQSGA